MMANRAGDGAAAEAGTPLAQGRDPEKLRDKLQERIEKLQARLEKLEADEKTAETTKTTEADAIADAAPSITKKT